MRKKQDNRIGKFVAHVDNLRQHEIDRKLDGARDEATSWKSRYSELRQDYESLKSQLELVAGVPDTVAIHEIAPSDGQADGEATVVAMLSDVHPFSRVRPETVNGVNEYTPDICRERLDRWFKAVVRLTNIERAGQNIPNLIVHLGGDLVGNMIHDELRETNYGTPQEEVMFMLENLESGFAFLRKHGGFEKITAICSHGNHDRDTKKKQFENQAEHALTWVLYHVLQRDMKGKVDFVISQGYHQMVKLYDRLIRFHHGDAILYQGGVGGPTISINKAIAEWNKTQTADLDMFGHLHQTMTGQKFFTNGSCIGYNTYALEKKMPFEPPRQWFVLLDRKRWVTSQRYICLDT